MQTFRVILSTPFYYSIEGSKYHVNKSNSGKWGVIVYVSINGMIQENTVETHRYNAKPTKKQLRQLHKLAKSYLVDEINK